MKAWLAWSSCALVLAACSAIPSEEPWEKAPAEEAVDEDLDHEGTLDVVAPGPFDPSQAVDDERGMEEDVTPPSEVSEVREAQEEIIEEAKDEGRTEDTQEALAENPPPPPVDDGESLGDLAVDLGLDALLVLLGAALLTAVVELARWRPLATAIGGGALLLVGGAWLISQLG